MCLAEKTINAIALHAVTEYPAECCGIVTGSHERQQVHPCRNIQDKLHEMNPEDNPRTSSEAYAIDPEEARLIMRNSAAAGEKVIAFYHSHIDCGAYFSQMDKDVQTVLGEPEFPKALHAVVSVHEKQVREIKGYRWDPERRDFLAAAITEHIFQTASE